MERPRPFSLPFTTEEILSMGLPVAVLLVVAPVWVVAGVVLAEGALAYRIRGRRRAALDESEAQRRRLEREMGRKEQRVEALLSSLGAEVHIVDNGMNLLYYHEGADDERDDDGGAGPALRGRLGEELQNASSGEGHLCHEALWGRDQVCESCPAARTFLSGQQEHSEITVGDAGGRRRFYQVVSHPIVDEDGTVSQVVEVVRDVTDTRRAELQLMQAGKLAVLGELAASVAHEVNNPLASISAYAEQLASSARDPSLMSNPAFKKFPGHLETIRKHVQRCKRFTSNLLNFARSSAGTRGAVDIPHSLTEALSLLEYEARKTGKRLQCQIGSDVPLAMGDRSEIQQIFLNLITNALDAIGPGGTVRISANRAGGDVEVLIADDGPGIPEELRSHVFDPFFTTKPAGKGTGLGLAICQRLARQLGASLSFETAEGEGTTFKILFRPYRSQGATHTKEAA